MALTITLHLGDVQRDLVLDSLLISEAREMERLIGVSSMPAFVAALQESKPDAVAYAWWLANSRAGTPIGGKFIDLDFDMEALRVSVPELPEAEPAPEEGADPDLPTSSGPEPESPTSR